VLRSRTRFCNFVCSNWRCLTRNRFFQLLSKYKSVDAGGKLFNNIGSDIGRGMSAKLEFIQQYKFTIAFENESYPGYTTEKIYEALFANTLPIYWGDPRVDVDFNPASFLNYHDYGSLEALLERVIEVDQNNELYCDYLKHPRFNSNTISDADFRSQLLAQFDRIFSTTKTPIARQRKPVRYFILHPVRRVGTAINQNSFRAVRRVRCHLNARRIQADLNRRK
jgi:alpha(1,3/1,4) fucosyltransferase